MAIVAPILIFLLIGVFEVGWALRGYLVLTNVNREVTRFSIRPGYLNYSVKNNNSPTNADPAYRQVGYDDVLSYTYTTLADELAMDFSMTGTATSTMIISHMVIDTGKPCVNMATCNCNAFVTDPNYLNNSNVYSDDDLILTPNTPGYQYFYSAKFPYSSTYQTKINYTTEVQTLIKQNNKFNCELLKKSSSTLPSANNVIITEIFYSQPQLFGFPLISNPLTNPVRMYAHTAMRMTVASRSGENIDTVGPVCAAYPITFPQSALNNPQTYPQATSQTLDLWDGGGSGSFGWLRWDAPSNSSGNTPYLIEELSNPRMSLNDYTNASDNNDHRLSIGDDVASSTGVSNAQEVRDQLDDLAGKIILIPIYDTMSGTGINGKYHITHFARVRINSYCLSGCGNGSKNRINGEFLGYDDSACSVN